MSPETLTPIEAAGQRVLDADFLDRLAKRISEALYYETHGPIGINGGVSPGLLHDDYDRLREVAKRLRTAAR